MITFTPITPIYDGDQFLLEFPEEINPPKKPTCNIISNLVAIECSTSKNTLIATLSLSGSIGASDSDDGSNSGSGSSSGSSGSSSGSGGGSGSGSNDALQISFSLDDIVNGPSKVESDGFYAYYTSEDFMKVSEYVSPTPVTITN